MTSQMQDNITFGFDKLSRDELISCFQGLTEDFKSFADTAFVESYATKLSVHADFVVGKSRGIICCLIAFYANNPPVIYISHVHTVKNCRKNGYLNRMLEMIVRNVAFSKFTNIRLEVRKENSPAISAYGKNGFRIIAESDTKFTMERRL